MNPGRQGSTQSLQREPGSHPLKHKTHPGKQGARNALGTCSWVRTARDKTILVCTRWKVNTAGPWGRAGSRRQRATTRGMLS